MQQGCQDFICNVVGGIQGVAGGVGEAISFAQDPFGQIFKALRDAAAGLARDVLPSLTAATLPDLSLGWFLNAYAISFAAAIMLAIFVIMSQAVKVARGTLAGRDLLSSVGLYFPMFLLGSMFGPLVGILLVNFFHALSNDVIAWGVAGSTDKITATFTAMIQTTDPAALTGGVVIACLLMLCMVIGLLLVVLMLIVQLVTLYFTGVLIPLGLVWIIDREKRPFGMKLVQLWVGILAAHPLLFFLLGVTFNLVAGSVLDFGSKPPLQALITLCVAVLSLFVASLSPMLLLKFAPIIPTGMGGTTGPALGRGDAFGPRNMVDAADRYGSTSRDPSPMRGDSSASGSSSSPAGATESAQPELVGAGSLSKASASRAAVGGAEAGASGGAAASGVAAGAGAGEVAGAAAAAGAAETATGVGAVIGIPTLIAAGVAVAAEQGIKLGNEAVDQAVAPMDDGGNG